MARTQITKNCLNCGTQFSRRLHAGREHLYCTQTCYRAHFKPARQDPATLFWSKVNKNGPNGCWLWLGAKKGKGYGSCRIGDRREQAHRAAWMFLHGPIPDGQQVLHHCDVRLCVNADSHLWLGSHDDNMADKMRKGRGNHLAGIQHPNALLEAHEIAAIRESRASISALSREYRVSRITIQRIRNRKAWLLPNGRTPLPSNPQSHK